MAAALVEVDGVVGVVLGGSRARGEHRPDSDVDLGIYHRGPLDIDALQGLADLWSTASVRVTPVGGWGPWVSGGGWLQVADTAGTPRPVDWIYRDLARVEALWNSAQRGEAHFCDQAGHPLGWLDVAYVGELALGHVLADPTGEVGALKARLDYPEALRRTLVDGAWQAGFLIDGARKGAKSGDVSYVSMCVAKAFALVAHALHAHARHWVVNEKGLVPTADGLPAAPAGFASRVATIMGSLGTTPAELAASLDRARALVDGVDLVEQAT